MQLATLILDYPAASGNSTVDLRCCTSFQYAIYLRLPSHLLP